MSDNWHIKSVCNSRDASLNTICMCAVWEDGRKSTVGEPGTSSGSQSRPPIFLLCLQLVDICIESTNAFWRWWFANYSGEELGADNRNGEIKKDNWDILSNILRILKHSETKIMESANGNCWHIIHMIIRINKNSWKQEWKDNKDNQDICQTSWQFWSTLKPKEGKVQKIMANYSGEWLRIAKNGNGSDETIRIFCQTSWQLWNTLKPKEWKVQIQENDWE